MFADKSMKIGRDLYLGHEKCPSMSFVSWILNTTKYLQKLSKGEIFLLSGNLDLGQKNLSKNFTRQTGKIRK